MSKTPRDFIEFKERVKSDGSVLLDIKLNYPEKLNVLNWEMISALNRKVREWENRKELSALFIHSTGERAFCAGGDVVQVYRIIEESQKQGRDPALAVQHFFQTEYETDYRLCQFHKPVILWGNGIVMGGGMGLFMSASHPILTENSRLAMPEAGIGFFPDVGASYFLNQIQNDMGKYMALTACPLDVKEALFLNLSEWAFPQKEKQNVLDFLLSSSFKNKEELDDKLKDFYKKPSFLDGSACWIEKFKPDIIKAMSCKSLPALYDYFSKAEREDKKWERNRQNFLKASPSSLAVLLEQLKRAKQMEKLFLSSSQKQKLQKSLFEMETVLSMQMARRPDFLEGVRALLIEKTKNPQWQPHHVEELSWSEVDKYFVADKAWDCRLKV